jgi:uncharacterized membrane protein
VVQGLFRESFNKHVMGLVVGTFTYCLVVLRSVHSALEPGGEPVIPNVSVAVGVVLGIASLLAIVAFISHNAHKMDVSEILAGVASQTVDKLVESWPEPGTSPDAPATSGLDRAQPFTTFAVRFERSGWIQYVDRDRMRRAVPDGTLVRLLCTAGQYATAGAPLCTLSPEPTGEASDIVSGICAAVQVGAARTIVQDPSYGIRQLADVALKALSPGVNDPTTAQDAVFHLGGVLAEAYRRDPPPMSSADDRGRVILDTVPVGHAELTALAFSEIRLCGVSQPQVAIYLLETMATLLATLDPARGFDARRALVREAQLVLAGTEREALLPEDIDRVRAVYVRHFGADASGRSGATTSGNRTDG